MSDLRKLGRRPTCSQIQRLITHSQDGSADALGEMLEGCRQYLLLIANERLDPELIPKAGASDIVQETFVSAGRNISTFRGTTDGEFRAWLRQILLNHLATARRRFIRSQKRSVSREVSLDRCENRGIGGNIRDRSSQTPSQNAVRNERTAQIERAMERLPARYRHVIQLRHRDHMSFQEVARELRLSPPAARQLWIRAIHRLQATV